MELIQGCNTDKPDYKIEFRDKIQVKQIINILRGQQEGHHNLFYGDFQVQKDKYWHGDDQWLEDGQINPTLGYKCGTKSELDQSVFLCQQCMMELNKDQSWMKETPSVNNINNQQNTEENKTEEKQQNGEVISTMTNLQDNKESQPDQQQISQLSIFQQEPEQSTKATVQAEKFIQPQENQIVSTQTQISQKTNEINQTLDVNPEIMVGEVEKSNQEQPKVVQTSNTQKISIQGGIKNRNFVCTGKFKRIDRKNLEKCIVECGGKLLCCTNKKPDYLVTGYLLETGRPVQLGLKYRIAMQNQVKIIDEDEFERILMLETNNKKTYKDYQQPLKKTDVNLDKGIQVAKVQAMQIEEKAQIIDNDKPLAGGNAAKVLENNKNQLKRKREYEQEPAKQPENKKEQKIDEKVNKIAALNGLYDINKQITERFENILQKQQKNLAEIQELQTKSTELSQMYEIQSKQQLQEDYKREEQRLINQHEHQLQILKLQCKIKELQQLQNYHSMFWG